MRPLGELSLCSAHAGQYLKTKLPAGCLEQQLAPGLGGGAAGPEVV